MKNIMYISDTQAVLVSYKKQGDLQSIQQIVTQEIEEGAIIGGTIIKPKAVVAALEVIAGTAKSTPKKLTLVMDCPSIIVKKIKTPILKHGQYITRIRTEMQSAGVDKQEMVYGYTKLADRAILGYGIPVEIIDSYREVFEQVSLSLFEIISGAQCVAEFAQTNDTFKSGMADITIVQGVARLSMVFDKGEFVLSSRGRVYSETLVDNLAQEAVRTSQFCTAQQHLGMLEKCYYCGVSTGTIEEIKRLLAGGKMLAVDLLDTLQLKSEYRNYSGAAMAFIAVAATTKPTPLLKTLQDSEKLAQQQKNIAEGKTHRGSKTVAAIILLIVGFVGYQAYCVVDTSGNIARLNKQLADIEERAKQSAGYELQSSSSIESMADIRRYKEGTKRYDTVDIPLVDSIAKILGEESSIVEMEYLSEKGQVEFTMLSTSKYAASQAAQSLRALPGVKSLDYKGFESTDTNEGYKYIVTLVIKEPKPVPVSQDPAQQPQLETQEQEVEINDIK